MSSISSANSFLLSLLANWYSSPHHFEVIQTSDTRNSTASHRVAASSSARAQRWPAAMPRSGSRSRKMSCSPLQPSRISHACSASAQSSLRLEWLMNRRDKATPQWVVGSHKIKHKVQAGNEGKITQMVGCDQAACNLGLRPSRLLHFHLDAIARRCSGRKGALSHEAPDECGAGIAIDPWLRRLPSACGLDANDFLERHVSDDRVDLAVTYIGREREADRRDADMLVERRRDGLGPGDAVALDCRLLQGKRFVQPHVELEEARQLRALDGIADHVHDHCILRE